MILVTGATGFIGSHILYQLVKSGRSVRALYRSRERIQYTKRIFSCFESDPDPLLSQVDWVPGDVTDKLSVAEILDDITCIYHAAGVISYASREESNMKRVNIQGTANVVDASLEKGTIKLVHISSIASLGNPYNGLPVQEDVLWKHGPSKTAYAFSKYKGEMEVWRGIHEGLHAVILNPSIVVGPGMWYGAASPLFERIYRGLLFYPEGASGYVDVRDVASIALKIDDAAITGERFILNAENMAHIDLMNMIADALHKKQPRIRVNALTGYLACSAEKIVSAITGKPERITRKALQVAAAKSHYSSEKIMDALDFQFIPIKESVDFAANIFLREKEEGRRQ